jgi:hypothetical protein
VSVRESTWTYPVIESVHVLGLCVFAGLLLLWDLRLLGISPRRVPVSALASWDAESVSIERLGQPAAKWPRGLTK